MAPKGKPAMDPAAEMRMPWRRKGRQKAKVATWMDARGGCDGIKTGYFGFCTPQEEKPWWQVDLGEKKKLDRVVVFNWCEWPGDGCSSSRTGSTPSTSIPAGIFGMCPCRLRTDGVVRWLRLRMPSI